MTASNELQPLLPSVHREVTVAPVEEVKLHEPSPSLKKSPHPLLGLGLVALSAVCFSIVTTLVKYGTMLGLSSMEAIFWRSSVAFVLNRITMLMCGVSTTVPPADHNSMLLQCVFGFSCIAFGFYAISRMVLADASVLIFTSPVVTFFLGALLLHEPIDRVSLSFAVLSIVGAVCVLRPEFIFGAPKDGIEIRAPAIGVIAALLAAVTQALLYICVRKLQGIPSLVVAHYSALFSAVASLTFVLIFQTHIHWPVRTEYQLAVFGCGFFAFVGQFVLTKGFQLENAGIAAVMRYLDVVCVFLWDSFWLHEPVSPWSALGAVIVCGCALVIALRKAKII